MNKKYETMIETCIFSLKSAAEDLYECAKALEDKELLRQILIIENEIERLERVKNAIRQD